MNIYKIKVFSVDPDNITWRWCQYKCINDAMVGGLIGIKLQSEICVLTSNKPLVCIHLQPGLYLYRYRYQYRCLYSWYRHSIGIGKLIAYTVCQV